MSATVNRLKGVWFLISSALEGIGGGGGMSATCPSTFSNPVWMGVE